MQKTFSKKSLLFLGLIICVGCTKPDLNELKAVEELRTMFGTKITSAKDACALFPRTVEQINERTFAVMTYVKQELDKFVALDDAQRTFDNTARAYDVISDNLSIVHSAIQGLHMVSPDAAIRDATQQSENTLNAFSVDAFMNPAVYNAFKAYYNGAAKTEKLTAEQRYYLDELMRDFKKAGFELPADQFEEVKALNKEIAELCVMFEANINTDKSSITVGRDGLQGLEEHFINGLIKNDEGLFVLGVDYPTYFEVIKHCTVQDTRKRLFFAFENRAYPQNKTVLETIIAKRDQLAKKLGYASYAALDIDGEMAATPERAESFIRGLVDKARAKVQQEVALFSKNLPDGVTLDAQNRFNPWDTGYVSSEYKRKFLQLDDRAVAEYFEVEKTLNGVFDIYQKFLNLSFKVSKPEWAWSDDVQLIEVNDKETGDLRGYIFIDLYPRANKYSHACCGGVIHATQTETVPGVIEKKPSVSFVIANFPKATADRPALLKHDDVETFFHEFGHAMHGLVGATDLLSFSGTRTKSDFVEMPSQIFEEWMFDKDLLKNLSAHYQTNQPLSDEMIDKLIALKKFDSGLFISGQSVNSMVSLDCYKEGAVKDLDAIRELHARTFLPHLVYQPNTHRYASFGHLTGYAAKYYGYLWSKVFALDLFYQIKKEGLLNPAAGKRFVDTILGKGGSVDPNILLKNYLGREPQSDAFFEDLGIK